MGTLPDCKIGAVLSAVTVCGGVRTTTSEEKLPSLNWKSNVIAPSSSSPIV